MGNIAYHLFPISSKIETVGTSGLSPTDILSKQVAYVEERCENDSNPSYPELGSSSFIVLHTVDDDLVFVRYSKQSVEPEIVFNYQMTNYSDSFRLSRVSRDMTVSDSLKIIRKHCVKQEYEMFLHNCQHVARDSFAEISGVNTSLLRADYLRWYKKTIPHELKGNYEWDDDEYQDLKRIRRLVYKSNDVNQIMRALNPVNSVEGMKKYMEDLQKTSEVDLQDSRICSREWSETEKNKIFDEIMRKMKEDGRLQ